MRQRNRYCFCELLSSLHISPCRGWENSLTWPKQLCATDQGMNFRVWSLKGYTILLSILNRLSLLSEILKKGHGDKQ